MCELSMTLVAYLDLAYVAVHNELQVDVIHLDAHFVFASTPKLSTRLCVEYCGEMEVGARS